MSSHEYLGGSDYRPDQRYDQLDDLTRVRAKLITSGYDGLSADEAALADQFIEYLFSPDFPEELLPEAPDFPPGLPPRLQALLHADRGDRLPPDTPQN